MLLRWEETSPSRKLQQRHTFLNGPPGDPEEVPPIGLGKPAIALGDVGGDRERRPVQLVRQKAVSARELVGQCANMIGEVNGLLVDEQFFETERQ